MTMRSMNKNLAIVAICLSSVMPRTSAGQSAPAETKTPEALTGIVTDTSNAPLPGVTIVIKGRALSEPRTVVTDADGGFSLSGVPRGEYVVDATLSGMRSGKTRAVPMVAGGDSPVIRLKLDPAYPTESMTVTGGIEGEFTSYQPADKPKQKRGRLTFELSTNGRRLRTITPSEADSEVSRLSTDAYLITPASREYITAGINRQDLANDVWSAAAKNNVDLAPEVDASMRAEYLGAVRNLLDTGKVSENDLALVGPEVLRNYIGDIAAGKIDLRGIETRFADLFKLEGDFVLVKRNTYGRLKVSLIPPVENFLVRVDKQPFPSPQNAIVLIAGPHQVAVDVASKTRCSQPVTIEAGGFYPLECKSSASMH
jgi:hypothetical protein